MSAGGKHPGGEPSSKEQHPERTPDAGEVRATPVVPVLAGEDDSRSWGDEPNDHDAWLHEQRPPHWG